MNLQARELKPVSNEVPSLSVVLIVAKNVKLQCREKIFQINVGGNNNKNKIKIK